MNVKRERRPLLIIELTEDEAREFVREADRTFKVSLIGFIADSLASTYYSQTGERLTADPSLT